MNEDLQIEKGARLADVKAPEDLATAKARKFVSSKVKSRRSFRASAFAWGGLSIAFATCVALAVILFVPQSDDESFDVLQQESVHAATASVDSTTKAQMDSLQIDSELPVE